MRRVAALGLIGAFALAALGPARANDAEFARARARAAEGRAYISLRILDELLEENMRNEDARVLRAEILRREGRLTESWRDYHDWGELRPEKPDPWFWKATIDRWQGRLAFSRAEYDSALAIDPCHVGSLKGRARIWIAMGSPVNAEMDLRAALACRPRDPEATQLLAEQLSRRGRGDEAERWLREGFEGAELERLLGDVRRLQGRELGAREAYRKATESDPDDTHSLYWARQLGPGRVVLLEAARDRSEVVEGLDEEGLQVADGIVVPSRILYKNDHARVGLTWPLAEGLDLAGEASVANEAIENRDLSAVIYDFDVIRVLLGLEHRLSREWRFSWRAGGVGYESNEAGTLSDETKLLAEAELEWRGIDARFTSTYDRDTFLRRRSELTVQQGQPGGDAQFRIFERDRLGLEVRKPLRGGLVAQVAASGTHYDDGSDVFQAAAALWWSRSTGSVWLRYRHDPFPERFLGSDLDLEFVDYDAISLAGRKSLPRGLEISGEALAGRFGKTPRAEDRDVDGDGIPNRVEGPRDHNVQRQLRLTVRWEPQPDPFVSLGAEYFSDEYDFDTAPYNTINVHSWTFFAELEEEWNDTWRIFARYARGFLGDERDSDYSSDSLSVRVEGQGLRIDSPRFALEAGLGDNTIGEESTHVRVELTVPF